MDSSPRSDHTNSTKAMDKLRSIDQQRATVENRLVERLQRQLSQLTALLCATKWRFTALHRRRPRMYTHKLVDETTKKLRVEVGAFEYATKEQSELLTRALFQLDDILSNGDAAVKSARKALVVSIQQLLERADAMKRKASSLKPFAEHVIERLPAVPESVDEDMEGMTEALAEPATAAQEEQKEDDDWEHVHADDVRPIFASAVEEDEAKHTEQEPMEVPAAMEDTVMVGPEETMGGDDDEDEDEKESDEEDETDEGNDGHEDVPLSQDAKQEQSDNNEPELPVWRPYYQIHKRADGVYLVANLRGANPRHTQVHAMPQQGVLRISGVKYPTQKDLLLSRLSGAPTFGRFEIVERFPTQMLNLENASQQLSEDGTLQVRLPFYFVHHPRVLRRLSAFQPHRLVVW